MPIRIKPIQQSNKLRAYARALPQQFNAALDEIGKGAAQDLKAYVSAWKHKPTFEVVRTPQTVSVKATGPNAKIFGYVDEGTRPHLIAPKRKRGVLTFKTGYQPKTRPNNSKFKGSGKATGGFRSAKVVHHPGSKARHISRIIANKWHKDGRAVLRRRLGFARVAR